jgi:hypothetical protein
MSSKNTDLDKITQTVQYYFDGMYHSDTETLKKAFDPDAFLHGYFEGQLVHLPQVKVFDLYLGKYFTDYLSLIKVNDNWIIMNKMFHHQ